MAIDRFEGRIGVELVPAGRPESQQGKLGVRVVTFSFRLHPSPTLRAPRAAVFRARGPSRSIHFHRHGVVPYPPVAAASQSSCQQREPLVPDTSPNRTFTAEEKD